VLRRRLGGFGATGIDDDNLGTVRVLTHALPHDRVRNAWVGANEKDDVRLFEILVRIRRSIEAERLFVGHDRRGHALAGVAIAVQQLHAKLAQGAEQGHFFHGNLARAEKGDGGLAVLLLDALHALDEHL
jgi:hypothetical protein